MEFLIIFHQGMRDVAGAFAFVMDDLTSHVNLVITRIIHAAGHRVVFRAPCYPIDGSIEYTFNTVQQEPNQKMHEVRTHPQLQEAMPDIISQMTERASGATITTGGY
jgi:hypothetical protein